MSAFEMGDGSSAATLSRLAPVPLSHPHRDPCRFLHLALAVKFWIDQPPDVHAARPPITPCCQRAAAPPGGPILLHGHGTRERSVSGRIDPHGPVAFHHFRARRYRCVPCGRTCTVLPVDVLPHKHFSALTIALAFAFYGLEGRSLREVYEALNPTTIRGRDARGWDSVRRWLAIASALFTDVRPSPADFSSRQVAARAAMTIASRMPAATAAVAAIPSLLALAVCHPP